jgi:tRNA (mo5U34)-methyltransferase
MTARITDPATIRSLIAEHGRWWHEIELAPGIVTPGDDSNRMKLPILDALGFPKDMRGLRALDIGCSDGYFTFEMERRGAEVVAIDFVPDTYTGFATARKILGSRATYRMDNVYNLTPDDYGLFDIVLFMGVLYHLRKPLAALDSIRSVMKPGAPLFAGTMMIDEYVQLPDGNVTSLEALNPRLKDIPLWQAYPGDSLNGDYTNCFAPNRRALEVALSEAQFRVDEVTTVSMGGYARATAVVDERAAKYQRLDVRLEETPFDPTVPYFLDEEGAVHSVTGAPRVDAPRKEKRAWWKLWGAMLLLVLSCATARGDAPAQTVDRFLEALNKGDANILALFADDATVFFPMNDRPLRATGRDEIAAAFTSLFALPGYGKGSLPKPEDLRVQILGDTALVTFQNTNPNVTSRRTFVLRRDGGRWVIVHLHGSNIRAN